MTACQRVLLKLGSYIVVLVAQICLILVWQTMEGGIGEKEDGLAGALLELIELTHTA